MDDSQPEFPVRDDDHLRTLAVFYMIIAAFESLALLLFAWMFLGTSSSMNSEATGLMVLMLVFVLTSIGMNVLAAQGLRHRRNAMLIYLNAALTCTGFPLGTLLGGLTIAVMLRPTVKAAFQQADPDH